MPASEPDSTPLTYRAAGLDLEQYERTLCLISPLLRRTHTPRVVPPPVAPPPHGKGAGGGFASLFSLDYNSRLFARNYRRPVLVASTDGVGTKLKVATLCQKHDTVGIDLVAMSVNDCLCTGGEPLFFLDYLAMPRDDPTLARDLIKGISDGCLEADCALVGGETAILPDVYQPGDYDMAGFCVGVVERDRIVSGKAIQVGDVVLGLASSGLHANGYSLARKIVFERAGLKVTDYVPELGRTVGDELLEPTRIYVRAVKHILEHYPVKKRVVRGLAHITGEGLRGNVPRILPPGRRVRLRLGSWPMPPVFPWLQRLGQVPTEEMFRVFNMGIGFVMIVSPYFAESIQRRLAEDRVSSYVIGEVCAGEPGVDFLE
ncbi:MAG: phosphoribosylformylglycinamidine cyclo-ligase [Gemmataceae bacterium]|nr:phosphoribosylformylglycinamidine cyclo-ligase [Gemmataceae bacterium]MDW8266141.1 phosphoribosylformylglycinamidine cyclo-ligase [Gemmataceae bacterium]